jgi:YVTN family beta-propeller protein
LYVVYGPHNIPNKVWVFQATSGGLLPLTSIDVGDGGSDGGGGIAANPSTNRIYVTNSAENSISVINGATDNVMWTIHHPAVTLQDPYGIAVNRSLNQVYVINRSGDDVVRFPGY